MTKNDLLDKLVKMKIPMDVYSLNGGFPNEAYCLNHIGDVYEVYYSERGQKSELKSFGTESEACKYLFESIIIMMKRNGMDKTNGNNELKWVECDAGPHILLEKRLIASWGGVNKSSNKRIVYARVGYEEENDSATDYDMACDIDDYIGLISVGDGNGIVIADDVPRSTWIAADDQKGGYLVILNYIEEGTSDNTIINKIREAREECFEPTDLKLSVQDNTLYLFAACDSEPNWIYGFLEIQIEPGTYSIDTIENFNFGDSSFRVHRLKK